MGIFASISAKVGSIGDNQLGGWYGYRASKSALNMFIKTLAIEFDNRKIPAVVLAIHPGTTATELSRPYVSATKMTVHSVEKTADHILSILDQRNKQDSGKFLNWDGSELPW